MGKILNQDNIPQRDTRKDCEHLQTCVPRNVQQKDWVAAEDYDASKRDQTDPKRVCPNLAPDQEVRRLDPCRP
jgi:hypothetical protein